MVVGEYIDIDILVEVLDVVVGEYIDTDILVEV